MAKPFNRKRLRKWIIAVPALGAAVYFVPWLTILFLATGTLDVLRNERKNADLFERYFLGNGVTVWLLSPVNLLLDLLCYRNRKIYRLDDFPQDCRREIEDVLAVFTARKSEIVGQVDRTFETGRRGMFVYRWFGRRHNEEIAEFNKPFRYLQTIAVSVFEGNESTSFHFGPLRLTLRILYNLTPVRSDDIFIECGRTRHYWHQDPLFIFDDTLMHRSVNRHEGRRYCVFMDVIRPSPVTPVLRVIAVVVSVLAQRIKGIFYQKWRMLGTRGAVRAARPES